MPSRTVSFAGSAVAVEWEGGPAGGIVDFLFGPPAPDSFAAAPHIRYRLVPGAEDGTLALTRDGTSLYEGNHRGAVAELLQGSLCRDLADRSRGGLVLHAAALAWKGRTLLLPGGIGRGKSTLTLKLIHMGPAYLTDEMVFVDTAGDVHAFRRPLCLKGRGRDLFPGSPLFQEENPLILATPEGEMIHPSLLCPADDAGPCPAGLIVVPRYAPQGPPVWVELSPAQAAHELMRSLVNARNLTGKGFGEAVALAKKTSACRTAYSSFDDIEAHLEEVLGRE